VRNNAVRGRLQGESEVCDGDPSSGVKPQIGSKFNKQLRPFRYLSAFLLRVEGVRKWSKRQCQCYYSRTDDLHKKCPVPLDPSKEGVREQLHENASRLFCSKVLLCAMGSRWLYGCDNED
jgi:hypothetical protein